MKRALSQRIKQDNGDVPGPSAPPEYTSMNGNSGGGGSSDLPPSKIPRTNVTSSSSMAPISAAPSSHAGLPQSVGMKRPRSPPNASSSGNVDAYQSSQKPRSNDNSNSATATTPTPAPQQGSGRRKRSAIKQDSSDDEGDDGAFYLKQQNSSLAAELYAYRRRIYLLEREREARRKECRVAENKIGKLSGVWKGLESAIGKELESNELLKQAKSLNGGDTSISATGAGTDVETVNSLLHSIHCLVSNTEKLNNSKDSDRSDPQYHVDDLNNFEGYSKGTIKMEEDDDLLNEKRRLKEMDEFATDIASRAVILRDGVLGLLRAAARGTPNTNASPFSVPSLKEQIATLESDLKVSESKLEEMASARNEAAASERRVRRGLYRLASGRLSMEDVLKAVEKEDNGVSFMETLAMIDGMSSNNKAATSSSPDGATSTAVVSSDAMTSPAHSAAVGGSKESPAANGEEVAQLKKNLQDVKVIAETRDKKIAELLTEREVQLKRINSLLLPKDSGHDRLSEDAIRRSPLFVDAMTKLATSERRVKELESLQEKVMQKWAAVKGDLDLAKKTLSDMEEKHGRRWTELVSQFSESDSAAASSGASNGSNNTTMFSTAKRTAELESKLQQTMEAVSRMETLRTTLADAYKMNEQLQSKLEDLKTKNAKMVAEKVATREKSKDGETPAASDSITPSKRSSIGGGSSSDPTTEKLQRDYRRARKEVSAAVLSKDQAKLKQERAEKERDALMKTNSRLLKQSSDKDDMNAKSLSTILHLKQRNEELDKESAVIKQKSQAAQQLSLAARLASNAKNRVGEEALKEKEALDETVKQLRNDCEALRKEKEHVEGLLAQSKEQAASITKDLDAARARCDDLVSESSKKEEEKKQMMESVAVWRKEANESAMKAAAAGKSGGGGDDAASAFTMDQMKTQVKYLSTRINCPVCNVREKKCILLRCRHMFCQQCVDINVKNRSRKCPACAQRFDMKDMAEIWL